MKINRMTKLVIYITFKLTSGFKMSLIACFKHLNTSDIFKLILFISEFAPRKSQAYPDPPLYLCLRLGTPQNKNVFHNYPIESYGKRKKKPEYWFSIPREKWVLIFFIPSKKVSSNFLSPQKSEHWLSISIEFLSQERSWYRFPVQKRKVSIGVFPKRKLSIAFLSHKKNEY